MEVGEAIEVSRSALLEACRQVRERNLVASWPQMRVSALLHEDGISRAYLPRPTQSGTQGVRVRVDRTFMRAAPVGKWTPYADEPWR